jgi:hypothetical protein
MTPVEALEQLAVEFEQRRAKLASAAASSRIDRRRTRDATVQRAAAAFEAELHAQINELTWVIGQVRDRAATLRSDTEAA